MEFNCDRSFRFYFEYNKLMVLRRNGHQEWMQSDDQYFFGVGGLQIQNDRDISDQSRFNTDHWYLPHDLGYAVYDYLYYFIAGANHHQFKAELIEIYTLI